MIVVSDDENGEGRAPKPAEAARKGKRSMLYDMLAGEGEEPIEGKEGVSKPQRRMMLKSPLS